MKNIKYKKIIIWGYPLYSHTHSYVHNSYYKAFKHLGYDAYWFHDNEYPKDFDFNNCLFIGEGFADKNLPLNESSCYFIMYCPSPKKYEAVGEYYDVRMAAENFKDHIHEYSLDKTKVQKIGPACYFEPKNNNKINIKNNYVDYIIDDYNKVYISWATNLLPEEINCEDINLKRDNVVHFCGSISADGICHNYNNFKPFIEACHKNNVQFIYNNPWSNPLSDDEVKRRIQQSILGIDIRGAEHLKNNLLTCRTFKNISYGHLGLTNSSEMYNELEGNCIYNPNTEQLFYDGMKNKNNTPLILNGMKLVKENHTYINRIHSLLSLIQ